MLISIKNEIKDYLKDYKINVYILTIYLSFVFFSQIFIRLDNVVSIVLLSLVSFIIAFFISLLSSFLLYKFKNKNLITYDKDAKFNYKWFIISFIIQFIFGLIIMHLYYGLLTTNIDPTNVAYDTQSSISQVINHKYTNWHPYIFTLLYAKIPFLIKYNDVNFMFIYFIIMRSIAYIYVITDIYSHTQNKIIFFLLLIFYTLTPLSIFSTFAVLKDTPCGYFVLLTIYLIFKNFHNKEFYNYKRNIFIGIFLTLSTIMRHNMIVYSIPIIIVLFFLLKYKLKSFLSIFITFIVLLFIINFPLKSILKVEEPSKETLVEETMGLPVSVISYIAKVKPEALDGEILDFAMKLSNNDISKFKNYDEKQGYDSIKPEPDFKPYKANAFINRTRFDFIKYLFNLILKEPKLAFNQIFNLTCGVYALRYRPGEIKNIISALYLFFSNLEIPICLFLTLLTMFSLNKLNGFKEYNVSLIFPILIYTFITMCLLSANGIHRYFLPLQVSMPIYLLFNLLRKK